MAKINSDDIIDIILCLHLPSETTKDLLAEHVYNDVNAWKKFLRIFFMAAGMGMLCSGIVMFFAYNWNAIHKFAKFAMLEGLIVVTVLLVLFAQVKDDVRNMILTGATLVTGALFAVFGQIYQTGADAYDFFLGWTLAVTLWVFVAGFAPLWVIYIVLVNTTLIFYFEQVVTNESPVDLYSLLFGIDLFFLVLLGWVNQKTQLLSLPRWFFHIVAVVAAFCATTGIVSGIFGDRHAAFVILLAATGLVYMYGVRHALRKKRSFYLSLISFSLIVIVTSLILKNDIDAAGFLLAFIFVILAITGTIRLLITLHKKWTLD
jgi:uncharacterized membrane protein